MDQGQSKTDMPNSPRFDNADWFLQFLIDQANRSDLEFGVTLIVGGVLVSGAIVSGRKYFEGCAQELREAPLLKPAEKDNAEALASGIEQFKKIYIESDETDKEGSSEKKDWRPLPQYVHLKNARIYAASGEQPIPHDRGIWWRGRLDAVDGFIMGNLART